MVATAMMPGPHAMVFGVWFAEWADAKIREFRVGQQARVATWAEAVAGEPGSTPEENFERLDARTSHDGANDVVMESIRALLDVVDDAAVPLLGRLARQYLTEQRPVDWFFRGMANTLRELTGAEISALRAVAGQYDAMPSVFEIALGTPEQQSNSIKLMEVLEAAELGEPVEVSMRVHRGKGGSIGLHVGAARLISVLKRHGLAHESHAGSWGSSSGPTICVMTKATLYRVSEVVAPSA